MGDLHTVPLGGRDQAPLNERPPFANRCARIRDRVRCALGQDDLVGRTLNALAQQLETISRRIESVGLTRAAADLRKVAAELRRIQPGAAPQEGASQAPSVRS
jgi:hypothetical protein